MILNKKLVSNIINNALKEDIGFGDITTEALLDEKPKSEAVIWAKERGIISGLVVAEMVFKELDSTLQIEYLVDEGAEIKRGTELVKVSGSTKNMLTGERLALNFLQRMSGIATKTKRFVDLVKDYDLRIVDTRKTTPGLRILEKYAVRTGGGHNHRFRLDDAVIIKDNHIRAVGNIKKAVVKARNKITHTIKIEVETENLEDVKEALEAEADIIMLDNMSYSEMEEAVELIANKAITEASGGININNLLETAKTGVDVISIGELTHKIDSLDIGMDLR